MVKIITWNMGDGATKFNEVFASIKSGTDIICLQECGEPQFSKGEKYFEKQYDVGKYFSIGKFTVEIGTKFESFPVYVLYCFWGESSAKCSMAVISRVNFQKKDYAFYTFKNEDKKLRPAIGIKVNDIWNFCIHSASGDDKKSSAVANNLVKQISKKHKHWVCAGDYNCPTSYMDNSNWICVPGGVSRISYNKEKKEKKRKIDYMITSKKIKAKYIGIPKSLIFSDHYAQEFSY